MKKVILASQSPRRLEILRAHGIEPIVMPSDAEEILPEGIGMQDAVMLLARQKAKSVYKDILDGRIPTYEDASRNSDCSVATPHTATELSGRETTVPWYSDSIIIGSDTIVYKDEIMGKPVDADDAFKMLSSIRNTVHYVATGVAIIEIPTIENIDEYGEYGESNEYDESVGIYCMGNLDFAHNVKCTVLCDVTEVHCKDYTDEQIWEYIEQEKPYDKAGSYAIQGPFGKYIDHIVGDYENVVGLPYHSIKDVVKDVVKD